MPNEILDQILQKIHLIPPLPAAVERLCEMVQDPEVDGNEVAKVLSANEVLTSRILRVANSTFYGLSQKVGSVSQAIVVLGLQGVKNLAVGVTIFGFRISNDHSPTPINREALWRHSLGVAAAACQLSRLLDTGDPEETFTAGLLHDIGKVVFIEFFPDRYALVLEEAVQSGVLLHSLEEEVFGINHASVGGELCRHWKMPPSLIRMVSEYPTVLDEGKLDFRDDHRVVAIRVADNLARIVQIGSDGEASIDTNFLKVFEAEDLAPEQLRQILLTLPEEVRKTEVFFNLLSASPIAPLQTSLQTVAVALADLKERELLKLLLLTLGFSLIPVEELAVSMARIAGVIADQSLTPLLKEILEKRGIPILDFVQWRNEKGDGKTLSKMSIPELQEWLTQNLRGRKGEDTHA